jgi:septum site-determining protein MinC
MRPKVQFKGIREGLLVTLSDGEWPEIELALMEQLDAQGEFLRGAKLILNVENHVINAAALGKLRDHLSDKGLTLWAVLTNSPTTETNAQAMGMATRIYQGPVDQAPKVRDKKLEGDEAILIHRTLRSGASIKFDGHIIVIGDVNPGAEIIAGGNIMVWGKLRGMVHAGANGNTKAVVCALGLTPTQLRIGDKIAVSPSDGGTIRPEMAFIRENKVVAEPWMNQGQVI